MMNQYIKVVEFMLQELWNYDRASFGIDLFEKIIESRKNTRIWIKQSIREKELEKNRTR